MEPLFHLTIGLGVYWQREDQGCVLVSHDLWTWSILQPLVLDTSAQCTQEGWFSQALHAGWKGQGAGVLLSTSPGKLYQG